MFDGFNPILVVYTSIVHIDIPHPHPLSPGDGSTDYLDHPRQFGITAAGHMASSYWRCEPGWELVKHDD